MGMFMPKGYVEPVRQRALGGKAGTTIVFDAGGSAFDLTAGGSITEPIFAHITVSGGTAWLISTRVGTTYSGSTPAAYGPSDQPYVMPCKEQTHLHWAAFTSGSTTTISGTVFGVSPKL